MMHGVATDNGQIQVTSKAGRIETIGMNQQNLASTHQLAVDTIDRASDQEGRRGIRDNSDDLRLVNHYQRWQSAATTLAIIMD